MHGADILIVPLHDLFEEPAAHQAEIARQDEVVVGRLRAGVVQVIRQGVRRGGRHGRPHVVCVLDAEIHDAAERDRLNPHARGFVLVPRAQDDCSGGRRRPLGGRGSLSAVLQRQAVLALRRAEVGGRHGGGARRGARFHEKRGHGERLSHGGAGAELPEKRDVQAAQAESGRDALVQQVSGEDAVDIGGFQIRFFQGEVNGFVLQKAFRFFPARLA